MTLLSKSAATLKPSLVPTAARSIWPFLVVLALAILVQFVVKPFLGDGGAFFAKLLLDVGINIMLAVSLTMVNGFTGQFSIGHAAFMAIGAYASAGVVYYSSAFLFGGEMFANATVHGGLISGMRTAGEMTESAAPIVTSGDLLFLVSLVIGGLLAAACGYIVGLPSLRLKGDYLAIVTLGFGEIVRVLIQVFTTDVLWDVDQIKQTPWYSLPAYLGGPVGFTGLPFYTSLFWVTALCGVTLLIAYRLKESTHGRAFLSIREDEIAASAMGVNTTKYKVRAFVIAAFFAGIAGGLYAHTVGVQLNSNELGFIKSFDIIIMVVLGGLGSISGAAIAAVILTPLPELLRKPEDLLMIWPFALGALALGLGLRFASRKGSVLRGLARLFNSLGVIGLILAGIAWLAMTYHVDLAGYRMVLYALALIIMMILRPQGLLGVLELWSRTLWKSSPRDGAPRAAPPAGPSPGKVAR
jgi:branched-chain amino acid transport system permease protein